ncbi:MAG TPA: G5 domain-containing protein [Anaerolineae bacterium]
MWFFVLLAACAPSTKRVILLVDGDRRVVETQGVTVQDVLTEQNIALGDNDRVDPPLYAEVARSATITLTRVETKTQLVSQPIPFTRQLVRDESYPASQMRVVQLGANGTVQITYTITLENGQETSRRETGRQIMSQPKDEIMAVGTLGNLTSIPLAGSVVYLANGNAWVMRHSNLEKRPLSSMGDLDGRVFSLSADGRYLLFSRAANDQSNGLNTLWLIDTLVLGETPRALAAKDVLYAQLAPDARSVVYSTGEKTQGAPGWKAHNDLFLAPLVISDTIPLKAAQTIWQPRVPAPFSWWGTNFAIAPDGRAVAYAFANEIGFVELTARASTGDAAPHRTLKEFAPFRTHADWVWMPQIAWSPDSRFVVGAVHAPLGNPSVATDDPAFEVWALARDGTVNAPLAKQTGMWTAPAWSPPNARGESQVAFGVALTPSDSERSRYALTLMDRDGGNKKQVFPITNEDGLMLVQVAWSPDARQIIAVRDGDLWLYDLASGRWSQLTANGASSLPRWGK